MTLLLLLFRDVGVEADAQLVPFGLDNGAFHTVVHLNPLPTLAAPADRMSVIDGFLGW
jgi:hypothetical protein